MKFLHSKRFGGAGGVACEAAAARDATPGTPRGILNYEITHRELGGHRRASGAAAAPPRRPASAATAPSRPPAWGVRWITFARSRLTQIGLLENAGNADH